MTDTDMSAPAIDAFLARALSQDDVVWPAPWNELGGLLLDRVTYHGIAGLLVASDAAMAQAPPEATIALRDRATGQSMWELAHRTLLSELLDALAAGGIVALLLKGSALAYDLYPIPAARARGDSDLFIAESDLARARALLAELGLTQYAEHDGLPQSLRSQEQWARTASDGASHSIDLHWRLLNSPLLENLVSFAECARGKRPLPRLGEAAFALDRVTLLLHACLHRAMHITAPYFVDGVTFYGGDRLIWLYDFHLLAGAFTEAEWRAFTDLARAKGVGATCVDGLAMAQRQLGTAVPGFVTAELSATTPSKASRFLQANQLKRTLMDLSAIAGVGPKLAYIAARGLPDADFMRAKYPAMNRFPLAALHARRILGLLRKRPTRSAG